jgi:hypothetical protein
MNHTPYYRLHRIGRRVPTGVTEASSGTLKAILKFDHPESPHCVYNEYVVVKLAQTLHAPIADGGLITTGDGATYASLEINLPGITLPNLLPNQIEKVADQYELEVAALTAFDIFIGNMDRNSNLKANLVTPHIPLFRAYDHSHALLTIRDEIAESIEELAEGALIVERHPFYGHVYSGSLERWAQRIADLPNIYIEECCVLGRRFREVSDEEQAHLAAALIKRKKSLLEIIKRNQSTIRAKP